METGESNDAERYLARSWAFYDADPSSSEGFKWFLKSAEAGRCESFYLVGLAYFIGCGTLPDNAKAVFWMLKAACEGNPKAQLYVGMLLANGEDKPPLPKSSLLKGFLGGYRD